MSGQSTVLLSYREKMIPYKAGFQWFDMLGGKGLRKVL